MLKGSRGSHDQDVISNRHIQQNPNTNFISILGQHDSSAQYFEVMRDEPKHPHNMTDLRTSKNSQAKGPHEDLPYLNQ